MDAAALRAELEAELAWRLDELRFLRNQLSDVPTEDKKGVYRKALVVMLYSHFEGFCKTAFSVYVHALNHESLSLRDVTGALAACCLARIFGDLRNPARKSDIFRSSAADDSDCIATFVTESFWKGLTISWPFPSLLTRI